MDLYGSWEAAQAASSGPSTPSVERKNPSASDGHEPDEGEVSTPRAERGHKAQPTLEEEIEQMSTFVSGMSKNFGSYWGQFRRQSATALKQSQQYATAAAKDITPLVSKAKAELDRLGEQAKASAVAGQAASMSSGTAINPDAPSLSVAPGSASADGPGLSEKSPNVANALEESENKEAIASIIDGRDAASTTNRSPPMNATAFFSRLQNQLSTNPNFQSFQHQFSAIQTDLKSKVGSQMDFSKIDLADAQKRYESAMNQGEKYFKVASKEISDLFGEAVRIVPPEEEAKRTMGAGKMADKRRKDAEVAAAGRTESLLYRVRSDPTVLLVDPAQPPSVPSPRNSSDGTEPSANKANSDTITTASHIDTREAFAKFLQDVEEKGGFEGQAWQGRINAVLDGEESGHTLKQTLNTLVPSQISIEAFWTRYFFRVQQIEDDEARRREILEGAIQQEEDDFSWDMEEDDGASADSMTDNFATIEGKGKARAINNEENLPTPKLGAKRSAATIIPPTDTESDVEHNWGTTLSTNVPALHSPDMPISSKTESETDIVPEIATKSSTPRNSSEEGTASSFDIVSATSAEPPGSPSETKSKNRADANADEEDDSDWE